MKLDRVFEITDEEFGAQEIAHAEPEPPAGPEVEDELVDDEVVEDRDLPDLDDPAFEGLPVSEPERNEEPIRERRSLRIGERWRMAAAATAAAGALVAGLSLFSHHQGKETVSGKGAMRPSDSKPAPTIRRERRVDPTGPRRVRPRHVKRERHKARAAEPPAPTPIPSPPAPTSATTAANGGEEFGFER